MRSYNALFKLAVPHIPLPGKDGYIGFSSKKSGYVARWVPKQNDDFSDEKNKGARVGRG